MENKKRNRTDLVKSSCFALITTVLCLGVLFLLGVCLSALQGTYEGMTVGYFIVFVILSVSLIGLLTLKRKNTSWTMSDATLWLRSLCSTLLVDGLAFGAFRFFEKMVYIDDTRGLWNLLWIGLFGCAFLNVLHYRELRKRATDPRLFAIGVSVTHLAVILLPWSIGVYYTMTLHMTRLFLASAVIAILCTELACAVCKRRSFRSAGVN